jgi:hypothetical protein
MATTPEPFWAADKGDHWNYSDSKEAALAESREHTKCGHAMRLRQMKLSELIEMKAEQILDSWNIVETLSDCDGTVEYCGNDEADPLGEDYHADDESWAAIVDAGIKAMMAEADRLGLLCDGFKLLEDVWEFPEVTP